MLNTTLKSAIEGLEQQHWFDAVADKLQNFVQTTYKSAGASGMQIKDFMHGVWLGHPLHPVLTDVPIGAWTSAMVLDTVEMVSGNDSLAPGADALIGLGLVGAVGAAATGLTEWSETYAGPRRVGLVHGLLNVTAALFYGLSLADRIAGNRAAARSSALLGFAIATVSAYLGGELVFEEQIGVDHTQGQEVPQDFTPVMAADDLRENEMKRVEIGQARVLLARHNNAIYALCEVCAHQGGPLAEGKMENGTVVCPWHGSRFALDDGQVLNGPSTYSQPSYEARVRNGQIEVRDAKKHE